MPLPRRVALLVETSHHYGRDILRGIYRYVHEHARWSVYFRPHGAHEAPPGWLRDFEGDGILGHISDQRAANLVCRTGCPVVDVMGVVRDPRVHFIGADSDAVAEIALQHLLDRGFRNFAVCGVDRESSPVLDERCARFVEHIRRAGGRCDVFRSIGGGRFPLSWEREQCQMVQWITSLPKPVGLLTCYDARGHELLGACRRAGVLVPDEVAVVSAGNDELLCEFTDPPMTSVDLNPQRIGYEAARLLDRMMDGCPGPRQPTFVRPRGIVTRRSSDVYAIDDPDILSAARFIREHACEGINVGDVLRAVTIDRRELERRFREILGRSPKAEIIRLRLQRAKELLAGTDLTLTQIALKSGFSTPAYFMDLFRKKLGVTPGAYRKLNGSVRAHRPHVP